MADEQKVIVMNTLPIEVVSQPLLVKETPREFEIRTFYVRQMGSPSPGELPAPDYTYLELVSQGFCEPNNDHPDTAVRNAWQKWFQDGWELIHLGELPGVTGIVDIPSGERHYCKICIVLRRWR